MTQMETYMNRISALKRDAYDRGPSAASIYDNAAWSLLLIAKDDDWKRFNKEVKRLRSRISKTKIHK